MCGAVEEEERVFAEDAGLFLEGAMAGAAVGEGEEGRGRLGQGMSANKNFRAATTCSTFSRFKKRQPNGSREASLAAVT